MLPLFDDVQNQFPVDAVANFQVPTEFNHWFQKRANDDAIRFYDALSFWPTLNVNESGVLYISMFKVSTTTTDMINLYHTIEQAFAPLAETGFRYHITWDKHNGPADTLLPTPMPFKGTNWETVYVYIFK